MTPINILIVDDEVPARQRLADLLAATQVQDTVLQAANGYAAIAAIREQQPDLVFLDVQMPELSGFDVVAQVGVAEMPAVVFVTAYEQYALRAFEIHALDYLLKPYDDERFFETLERARQLIRLQQSAELNQKLAGLLQTYGEIMPALRPADTEQPTHLERLVVKSRGETNFVKVDEIDYIEGAGVYVTLHSAATTHLLRERMHQLESRLDPLRFMRIHRSAIVRLDGIMKLEHAERGELIVVLACGKRLKVSRSRQRSLQRLLGLQQNS